MPGSPKEAGDCQVATSRSASQASTIDCRFSQKRVLHLSAISLAELLLGVAVLPDGKRKAQLEMQLSRAAALFGQRILPFDGNAAVAYAAIVSRARQNGRATGVADGQIGAIAASRGFTVATRNIAPFEAAGVPVINPWIISTS